MIEIKEIEIEDLEELAVLLEELTEQPSNLDKMVANLKKMKENNAYIVLGAKYDNKLVGSLMGIICLDLSAECEPFMVIENVIVTDSMRGKGVGKALMTAIEDIAKEKGCYYTMLVSSMFRKDAHKFYEAMGYPLDSVQGFRKFFK